MLHALARKSINNSINNIPREGSRIPVTRGSDEVYRSPSVTNIERIRKDGLGVWTTHIALHTDIVRGECRSVDYRYTHASTEEDEPVIVREFRGDINELGPLEIGRTALNVRDVANSLQQPAEALGNPR